MKLFKRILLIVSGLIVLIAISLYLWLKIRESRSNKSLVHYQSEAIIKVSVDNIFKDIAVNALLNPGYYLKKDSTTRKTSASTVPEIGLKVSASMYFFTIPSDSSSIYGMFEVTDQEKFAAFCKEQFSEDNLDLVKDKDDWRLRTQDNRIFCIGNATQVLIGINLHKEDKTAIVEDLWADRSNNMRTIESLEQFDTILKDKNDIAYYNAATHNLASIKFCSGSLEIQAHLSNSSLHFPATAKARNLSKDNILNFYCAADIRPILDTHSEVLSKNNIPVDTLKRYFGGYMDLQWKRGEVLQKDTIVAYDYDDNFEMVEKKEIRNENVPHLLFTVKASPHISSFLPQKMFYKFNKQVTGDFISLSTANDNKEDLTLKEVSYPFFLDYQYHKTASPFFGWMPFLDHVKRIRIEGRKGAETSSSIFEGSIVLENERIHPISQLFR